MNPFSITIGRLFGIKTTIHWTFWILIIWIVYSNVQQGYKQDEIILYVLLVFAIFGCVVLHELGHALAARRFGIETRSITILPIGGVASLEKMPADPKEELVVAIAGPLVNVAIAAILFVFLSTTGKLNAISEEILDISGSNFLDALLKVNILLVVFNLIPAFPMDGGRVLRALLAFRLDRVRATEWAVNIGKFFAILFVFWGLSGNPFLIFIALFVFLAAQQELQHVRAESLLSGFTVGDIVMHDYTTLQSEEPLSSAVKQLLDGQEKRFLVMDGEKVTGFLTKTGIIQGLSKFGENIQIKEVMEENIAWLSPEMLLTEASELMSKLGVTILPVGKEGNLQGVLDSENLQEFSQVRGASKNREI